MTRKCRRNTRVAEYSSTTSTMCLKKSEGSPFLSSSSCQREWSRCWSAPRAIRLIRLWDSHTPPLWSTNPSTVWPIGPSKSRAITLILRKLAGSFMKFWRINHLLPILFKKSPASSIIRRHASRPNSSSAHPSSVTCSPRKKISSAGSKTKLNV